MTYTSTKGEVCEVLKHPSYHEGLHTTEAYPYLIIRSNRRYSAITEETFKKEFKVVKEKKEVDDRSSIS